MDGDSAGGGDGGGRVAIKMGKADSLRARFSNAAQVLDSIEPAARDVIPIDKLRKILDKKAGAVA
jgi:hypothetical protein